MSGRWLERCGRRGREMCCWVRWLRRGRDGETHPAYGLRHRVCHRCICGSSRRRFSLPTKDFETQCNYWSSFDVVFIFVKVTRDASKEWSTGIAHRIAADWSNTLAGAALKSQLSPPKAPQRHNHGRSLIQCAVYWPKAPYSPPQLSSTVIAI